MIVSKQDVVHGETADSVCSDLDDRIGGALAMDIDIHDRRTETLMRDTDPGQTGRFWITPALIAGEGHCRPDPQKGHPHMRRRAALVIYLVFGAFDLFLGAIYVSSSQFMPYHS